MTTRRFIAPTTPLLALGVFGVSGELAVDLPLERNRPGPDNSPEARELVDGGGGARHRWSVRKKACAVLLAVSLVAGAFGIVARSAEAASDSESAESLLKTVEGSTAEAAATVDARQRARTALERARRFRESGDDARARIADGLGLRAAELARDQARAVRSERATAEALRAAQDAGATVDRERALVEEAIAQAGRLRAQIEALEADRKREPERTASRVLNDAGVGAPPSKLPARAADGGAR